MWPSSSSLRTPRPSRLESEIRQRHESTSPGPVVSNVKPIGEGVSGTRAKRTSTACTACQKRKSKCTGDVPCDSCTVRGTICAYNELDDGRRRHAIKRKLEGQTHHQHTKIYQALQQHDEDNVAQLLSLIRSDAPLSEIMACIEQQNVDQEHADPLSSQNRQHYQHPIGTTPGSTVPLNVLPPEQGSDNERPTQRRRMLDIQRLSDVPLFRVPAKPWTSVDVEDDVVSHLISLFFTWCQIAPYIMRRDLFLQDMQSARLDASFCSPFLVNCMLALACPNSEFAELKSSKGMVSPISESFMQEAKRHLDREAGRMQATTVQGLAIMYTCIGFHGKDRQGLQYMRQLSASSEELGACQPVATPASDGATQVMSEVVDDVCWAVFGMTTASSLSWQIAPPIRPPQRPRSVSRMHTMEEWCPYPQSRDSISFYPSHIRCAFYDLYMLASEAARLRLVRNELPTLIKPFVERVVNLGQRCTSWFDHLPPPLEVTERCPPHLISIHAFAHALILSIHGLINDSLQDEFHDDIAHARAICRRAAIEIARLTQKMMHHFGTAPEDVPAVLLSISTLTSHPGQSMEEEDRKVFVGLFIYLREAARRWPFAMLVLRTLHINARVMLTVLPDEVTALLQDFQASDWQGSQIVESSSNFPNFVRSMEERTSRSQIVAELDEILEEYERLDVGNRTSNR